ncbi:hypothetical protein RF11_03730 [Thelohanellus kitauei]|uniref:Uncharacterized protein n=1 Tax=Thelohanellus kitauei TaxID=669202 RepID=A0A0C2JG34_THEKT|nr:hypothetical protein RF11_03730 [Thelohanellus kitauei]
MHCSENLPVHTLRALTLNRSPSAHTIGYFKHSCSPPAHIKLQLTHLIMSHSGKPILPAHTFLNTHDRDFRMGLTGHDTFLVSPELKIACQPAFLCFSKVNGRPPYQSVAPYSPL